MLTLPCLQCEVQYGYYECASVFVYSSELIITCIDMTWQHKTRLYLWLRSYSKKLLSCIVIWAVICRYALPLCEMVWNICLYSVITSHTVRKKNSSHKLLINYCHFVTEDQQNNYLHFLLFDWCTCAYTTFPYNPHVYKSLL